MVETPFSGILELIGDKKFGFVREFRHDIPKNDADPFVPPPMIKKFRLRDGVTIEGVKVPGKKGDFVAHNITGVMGMPIDKWLKTELDTNGQSIYPNKKFRLATSPEDIAMRVIDIAAPLGKGQRALIVAPPKTGKTILLHQIAKGISQNHPKTIILALLVDERPEEVTDFKRTAPAKIFASSIDQDEDNHVRVSVLALEHALRYLELKKDVVLLIDSLTRLGRTFNLYTAGSGRVLSGGLDSRALNIPRRIFGAAKNNEYGGSLTIIATALTDTGSRMDDVILEEFKGTGNAEIVLDSDIAMRRIFPAVNLRKSGTRNDENLLGEMTVPYHTLMRVLNSRPPSDALQALIKRIKQSQTNEELLYNLNLR
jgi:transcription termination factor Rho